MTSKILINAVDPEEVRLAIVKDSRLEEFHIESTAWEILHSSIYKGVINPSTNNFILFILNQLIFG